ncbi:hypothetical protein B0T20DRAFT_359563 [Sordaria brevicollis]|uniref:Uncharacterized protein n=1 Tax=Sordaria brevicollis TaxID=83679 RepID=A0AAE0U962_SORBR|nr:hypothetical protein B0T20DRAFT_359563 [Sordaria brevicollis]
METAEKTNRHDIVTTINYYADPGDGSTPMPVYVGKDQVTNKRPMLPVTMSVTDVTGGEENFTLNKNGFQYLKHVSGFATRGEEAFTDEERIQKEYLAECEELLKGVTSASRVLAFDHRVRRGPSDWHDIPVYNVRHRGPLHRAHVDQSYAGAEMVLREKVADADQVGVLMQRRWGIVNVWRPIKPIHKDPLGLCDARTVSDADLVPGSIILKSGHRRESWTIKHNPEHRWYFKYQQQPDEVVLIKCFDSESYPGMARRAPHCAIEDPDATEDEWRESVEVRCLVFW